MFDSKSNDNEKTVCGCGSITEAQADALMKRVSGMSGIPDYFVNGVAAGLYFACLESGDMRGTTIEEFVQNAHDVYIDKLVARKMHDLGGVLKVEVRHA